MNESLAILLPIYALALLLGIKHSLDVDHIVAVSSILTRSPTIKKTTSLALAWALGHMITASIITFILFLFKETLLTPLLTYFELLVAFMLIFIGVITLAWEFDLIKFGKHSHGHQHLGGEVHHHDTKLHTAETALDKTYEHHHFYFLSFKGDHSTISAIGIIHGLASNDELLLLLTLTLGFTDFLLIVIGVIIFTAGVVLGMISYAILIKYPLGSYKSESITHYLNISLAVLAIIYAFYLLNGGNTLNLLPIS